MKDVDLLVFGVNALGPSRVAALVQSFGIPSDERGLASGETDVRDLMGHAQWAGAKAALLATLGTTEAGFANDLEIYASWAELRALPRSVTIGNHGASHALLSALT